jgi:hypothetical protein
MVCRLARQFEFSEVQCDAYWQRESIQSYTMMDNNETKQFKTSTLEKDIGVLESNDLKWTKQVKAAASKSNKTLGLLAKTFKYKSKDSWKLIYCAYVRQP